jgi:hypothetical protein
MSEIKSKTKKKARIGRPPRRGGFSLMVRTGELPENRKCLRLYLTEVREGLIDDLGPTEADLSAAQKVLIERALSKLCLLRCIEEQVREDGVFRGGSLSHVLGEAYLAYSNSLRLDLQALGINSKRTRKVLDLGQYLAEKSRAPARKASPRPRRGQVEAQEPSGDDMAGLKIARPGAPGGDISGQAEVGIDCAAESGQDQVPESAGIVQPRGLHNEGEGKDDDRETNLS